MSKDLEFGAFDRTQNPIFPTSTIGVSTDGRFLDENGGAWALFAVPLNPTVDAKTVEKRLEASIPLYGALSEIASLANIQGIKRRRIQKGSYRRYFVYSLNFDAYYRTPYGHPLKEVLDSAFGRNLQLRRLVVLGVRLIPSITSNGFQGAIDSVIGTFQSGRAPLSDFNEDFDRLRGVATRHGLRTLTQDERGLVRAWFNGGKPGPIYSMSEPSRFHMFRTSDAARQAQELYQDKVPLDEWPVLPGHTVLTFASITEFNMPMIDVTDPMASWVSKLIDHDAVCVAIHGLLEPGTVTAKEIDANVKGYESDIKERQKIGKDATVEQEQKLADLAFMRQAYAGGRAPSISTSTSVTIAFNGDGRNLSDMTIPGCEIAILESRQTGAMAETWPTPTVRTNPDLHDVPLTLISDSGICSLSQVGDDPHGSALTGLTEVDRQPTWTNPGAAMTLADSPPLVGVFGMSGSGKTMLGLWHLIQFSKLGHKVVFVDPKEDSDFSGLFRYYGGKSVDLGDMAESDGILDPIRFSPDAEEGVDLAISTLKFLYPWNRSNVNVEVSLYSALRAGVEAGARSILSALRLARQMGVPDATDELITPIETIVRTVPMASALIGSTDTGTRLAFEDNLTLIKVGSAKLNLPKGKLSSDMSLSEKIAVSVIRLLVRGSTIAVRGIEGVVGLDEAWIFFDTAGDELTSLGRLARSMSVSVWMMTQRVSDIDKADLEDFISTGYILGMSNSREAQAACRMLKLEPTDERMARITAKAKIGGRGSEVAFNWNSLRALIDSETRQVVRGSVCLYADTADRAVYTEVMLPSDFLRYASTNKTDREKAAAS